MAFVMDYTDEFGDAYRASYWIPVQINICRTMKTGLVVWQGFRDAAARERGGRVIGQRTYPIDTDTYERLFGTEALSRAGVNTYSQVYALALETKDVGPAPDLVAPEGIDPEGRLTPAIWGPDERVSFFDGALPA